MTIGTGVGMTLFIGGFVSFALSPFTSDDFASADWLTSFPAIFGIILMFLSIPVADFMGRFKRK